MMEIRDFTVEYRRNPIGIDEIPRFSWKLYSDQRNILQIAYQIKVFCGDSLVWDSKKVESGSSVLVEYGGELEPMTTYGVIAQVWDNHAEQAAVSGTFETGLLAQNNWRAQWITHTWPAEETACPVFTKHINTENMKIKKARMYATACGVYEIEINGHKAGDVFLAPGWTSYHNRIQYQTYDIGALLKAGQNDIRICIGNGWYKGYLNCDGSNSFYGDRVAFLGMLCIDYEDGTQTIVGTDESWFVASGVIRTSELYFGETQDFTNTDRSVSNAVRFDASQRISKIVSQACEPIRVTRRISAKRKIITPKGELVIDFGQNMAGLVEVKLPDLVGEALEIAHGEALDKNGNFYNENYRTAISLDRYIYSKKDIDRVVMPHFTYHGFRYIKVEGVTNDVDISRFTACAMHTDMRQTGTFHCSNAMINQLQSNIEWGQRSNYFDIPTDCPQRDERLGWTGDAQIFAQTGSYNFHTALFFAKWMKDIAVESDEESGVPQICPNMGQRSIGTSIWSDCATVIPWTVYQTYGDTRILFEQYENMKLWVEYIRHNTGDDVLWMNGFQRGDWLSLDSDASLNLMAGGTDKNLIANVYYAYSTRILRDSAHITGKEDDEKEYAELYDRIVEALHEEYVTLNGRLVSETQTACALMLHFRLLREEHKPRVIKTLAANILQHKGHLTTGFVGTAFLCHALSEAGKHDLAETIVFTEDYPGWLYAVIKGATTIWERWNSFLPDGEFDQSGMNSLNHYSFGSIGDWLYSKVAGINFLEPGYKKILIKPYLTRTMPEVETRFESMYGSIGYHQTCSKNKIQIDIEIPANTTAEIILPEKNNTIEVGSGAYHYEYEIKAVLAADKYTMNTTIGELLRDEIVVQALHDAIPGFQKNASMAYLQSKTLFELAAMMPEMEPVLKGVMQRINHHYHDNQYGE